MALASAWAQQSPPSAAPTTNIDVNALPLVRPEAQALDDFLSGLVGGLMRSSHVPGVALVIVKGDHVLFAKGYGIAGANNDPVDPNQTQFQLGTLSELMTDVAAMQLFEQAHILLDEDAGAALSERDRQVTIADLLLGRAKADPNLLGTVVTHVSGEPAESYVRDHVLMPLAMGHSGYNKAGFVTTADDMSHFMLAMLNDGEYENARLLLPATIELMERMQFTHHPALTSLTYGFAELQRNGWRGVQRDGVADGFQARLVMIPETKTGYFIAINGNADAGFWRALDAALFDRLFPPREYEEMAISSTPAPTPKDAQGVAGSYAVAPGGYDILRADPGTLTVTPRADGALLLSGAENGVLLPHAGGFWRSEDGNLRAAADKNHLLIDTRVYERKEFPLVYLALAALATLGLLAFAAWRIMRA